MLKVFDILETENVYSVKKTADYSLMAIEYENQSRFQGQH